jgi:beta-glucanase (GH16 family)
VIDVGSVDATLAANAFSITSPTSGATVGGVVPIVGVAGSLWVNVATFNKATGAKIAADVTPVGGAFTVSLDTTTLASGPITVSVTAYSVPSGQPGGTSSELDLPLTVNQSAADGGPTGDAGAGADAALDGGWALTWSDEFNGADGSVPDPTYWTYTSLNGTTSGQGWGIESDTPSAVTIGGGNLVFTATQASDGTVSSGAIDTKGKFQQAYGRFEARIKVAEGAGAWSAFWLMGDTNGQSWPTCGEIDIVEVVASSAKDAYGTIHSGNTSNASQNTSTGGVYMNPTADMGDDFHVYAVEWSPNLIHFYVDGMLYQTDTPQSVTAGQLWPVDHPFYVILNLEVGGSWAGAPNASSFPMTMLVDYVRVYQAM